jgi:hypothetical protein
VVLQSIIRAFNGGYDDEEQPHRSGGHSSCLTPSDVMAYNSPLLTMAPP